MLLAESVATTGSLDVPEFQVRRFVTVHVWALIGWINKKTPIMPPANALFFIVTSPNDIFISDTYQEASRDV
jgi:hypothetical protein